jgi:hypothetical protein
MKLQIAGEADESWPRSAEMATPPTPPVPDGFPSQLADRAFVYTVPEKMPTVLPHVEARWSGIVMAGRRGSVKAVRQLVALGVGFPVLIDPEGYRHHTATVDDPFWLPSDGLFTTTLDAVVSAQLHAGVSAALTPTGYIPAGGTDELKAATSQFAQLGNDMAILMVPLDISLLGGSYFKHTCAILEDFERPVAMVLVCQGNPLDQRKDILPNLRTLARRVPLIPLRTDFNGLDLLGQGALFTAIGTGGSLRHAVDPAEQAESFVRGVAPSVLWPELLTFYKGSTIAEFFGAQEHMAPTCGCGVCGGRRITRFLRHEHTDEAIAHGVAMWSPLADRLLSAATVRERAETWKSMCMQAVAEYHMVLDSLQRLDGLRLQPSLERWAMLPAWPTSAPAPVA